MKLYTKLKWITPLLCVVGLSSCLKNINEQPDFSTATPVVELPVGNPKGDGSPNSLSVSLTQVDTPTDYFFMVNYASDEANKTDLVINLNIDPTVVSKYNTANPLEKPLTVVPSAAFTMPLTVTIPAGARKVQIPVKFVSTLLDPNLTYGLPVTIANAEGVVISKNFASVVVKVSVKNRYDGIYTMKGSVVRQGDTGGLNGPIKDGVTTALVTDGAYSNGFTQYWANGGGIAGIDNTTLTVDPLTNKVTVFSKANPALVNLPGFDNHYDPATRTFYLSFYWGNGPTHRAATVTLTYSGPR